MHDLHHDQQTAVVIYSFLFWGFLLEVWITESCRHRKRN